MAFLLVPDTVCFPHTSFPAPHNNCAVRAPPAKRLPEWRVRRDGCGWFAGRYAAQPNRLRGIEQWEMIGQKACRLSEVDCGWRSGYAESDLLVRLF